jgi:hypothetical protein
VPLGSSSKPSCQHSHQPQPLQQQQQQQQQQKVVLCWHLQPKQLPYTHQQPLLCQQQNKQQLCNVALLVSTQQLAAQLAFPPPWQLVAVPLHQLEQRLWQCFRC